MTRPAHLYLPGPWKEDLLPIAEGQQRHLQRSLRLSPGVEVTYTDGVGSTGVGVWRGSGIERGDERSEPAASQPRLVLAVSPPDERARVRFLVEKAAELGASRLVWIDSQHRQGRPPSPDKARAWAVAALEQSRGRWLMVIDRDMVWVGSVGGDVWLADQEGEPPRAPGEETTVVIGPEAGFAPEEVLPGWPRTRFGSQILRVETAAVAAASWFAVQRL